MRDTLIVYVVAVSSCYTGCECQRKQKGDDRFELHHADYGGKVEGIVKWRTSGRTSIRTDVRIFLDSKG